MTLVDSNVLFDLVTADPQWSAWSIAQLEAAALRGPLLINDVIYSELSVRYERLEALDEMVDRAGVVWIATPKQALFLAAKVFRRYRRAGGSRTGVLTDFSIGAHAAVADVDLLTRDPRRYRTYFPSLRLITPST